MATGTTIKVTTTLRLAFSNEFITLTNSIKVYFNLTGDVLTITTKDYIKDGVLNVISTEAKTLKQQLIKGNIHTVNVENIKSGTYFIKKSSKWKNNVYGKIIVQHKKIFF